MSPEHQDTVTVMAAKITPPASVIGASWLGFSVPEWIQIVTLAYVILLLLHKLGEMIRDGWRWWKDEHKAQP